MAINDILDISRQGMDANRRAMQTSSNNVANANTPGYSRQRVQLVTREAVTLNGIKGGGGVDVGNVMRIHDDTVERQLIEESKAFGAAKEKSEMLHYVQAVVQRESEGLDSLVSNFFNDVRSVSLHPELSSNRAVLKDAAEAVAGGFHNTWNSMEDLRIEVDRRIESKVEIINNELSQIANLNMSIANREASGDTPNELFDRRDEVLRELGKNIQFEMTVDQFNSVNITIAGKIGVCGDHVSRFDFRRTPESAEKAGGSLDIFMTDGRSEQVVTGKIKGALGGLVEVRDKVVSPALKHLDRVAFEFGSRVNSAHKEGVALDGSSGRNMFTDVGPNADGAAMRFGVNVDVKNSHEAIATGLEGGGIADNSVLLKIAEIQHEKLLPSAYGNGEISNETLNGTLQSMVGFVGSKTRSEDDILRHQEAVVNQLEEYRKSISGVSLEEEAIDLMKYQNVFNASAKALKVGDELLQTVLSLKN